MVQVTIRLPHLIQNKNRVRIERVQLCDYPIPKHVKADLLTKVSGRR